MEQSTELTQSQSRKTVTAIIIASAVSLAIFKFLFRTQNPSRDIIWFMGSNPPAGTRRFLSKSAKQGVEIFDNGDRYKGEFRDGKPNGVGFYENRDRGRRYAGDWVDGMCDGYGIQVLCLGEKTFKYSGQFRRGKRDGRGYCAFASGDTYLGEWRDGRPNGVGVHTFLDGSSYHGQVVSGAAHGVGRYENKNGDIFCGEFSRDKVTGCGVWRLSNGDRYEGSVQEEGVMHGYGMYICIGGHSVSAEWNHGKLKMQLTPPDDEPVHDAVKTAKNSADKANNLHQTDQYLEFHPAVWSADVAASFAIAAASKAVRVLKNQRIL